MLIMNSANKQPDILLVEPRYTGLYEAMLWHFKQRSWHAIHVESSGEALQALQSVTPRVLATNLVIPDQESGFELVNKVEAYYPEIIRIIHTVRLNTADNIDRQIEDAAIEEEIRNHCNPNAIFRLKMKEYMHRMAEFLTPCETTDK